MTDNTRTDWKRRKFKTLVGSFYEIRFTPQYSGTSFQKACDVAKATGAKVFEHRNRDAWIVSYEQPPFAFCDTQSLYRPDFSWSEV